MLKFFKKYHLLLLIFILAFTVRVFKVSDIPWGFDGDEAAVGYYSYSLLTNLSDEYGNKFPVYFPSIGDYKYPGYSYLSTIPVMVFGLSVFSARLLSVLAGSLLVVVIYFLSKEIFKNEAVARIAAFMTAFSPYGIIFSRGAYESNVATFLLALGIMFLLFFERAKDKKYLIFSGLSFVVSLFTYPSARVFIILFLPVFYLLFLQKNQKKNNRNLILFYFTTIIVLFAGLSLLDGRSRVRANDIGIINDASITKNITESIFEDGLAWNSKNLVLTRLYHNKIVGLVLDITQRYLQHFEPIYLFFQGNPNMPKYSVPNFGLFYIFETITILVGIYGMQKVKGIKKYLVFIWLILSAVPSALSIETPNPIRALIGLPAFILLSSFGVYFLSSLLKNSYIKLYYLGFIFLTLFLFSLFWHQYTLHKLYHVPWYTDEGTKEMVKSARILQDNYEKVVISGDPYIHFLFHNKILPTDFLATAEIDPESLGKWERVGSFADYIFKMPYACPKIGREHVLYVCRGEDVPLNSIVKDVIYFKDGKPAYILLEFIPYSKRTAQKLPDRVHYMVETDLNFYEALLSKDSERYW
jgi:4-amino-4-deoxy-L-arabinose transferase-like glycosyltransferase